MYVCVCYEVTERELDEVLDAGACTPKQVAADCRAGTGCGTCVRKIRAMIDESAGHGRLATGDTATGDGRSTCEAIGKSSNYSMSS